MAENTSSGSTGWNAMNVVGGLLGVAGTATGITALGVKQNKRNGCGNGYYDGYGNGADCPISRSESALESEVAMLKADRTTDAKILELYNVVAANDKAAGAQIAENAVQIALNKQAVDFQLAAANREFVHVNRRIDATDARLNDLTNEIIPISKVCPQPLSACQSIGIQGCIIPTEPTDRTVTTIAGNAKAKV